MRPSRSPVYAKILLIIFFTGPLFTDFRLISERNENVQCVQICLNDGADNDRYLRWAMYDIMSCHPFG